MGGSAGRDVARIYDRLGSGYDRLSGLLDRTAVSRMRADLLARARGDVLEVAVGTGANLRRYPTGLRITGLDFSAKALAVATERADAVGLDWAPVLGDAEALPFADRSVDTVVCTLAGCTFADPGAVFAEVRRVLRPADARCFWSTCAPRTGPVLLR
jgi:ubiquinone/menaquinone biosynthesis C-methylase UbiE